MIISSFFLYLFINSFYSKKISFFSKKSFHVFSFFLLVINLFSCYLFEILSLGVVNMFINHKSSSYQISFFTEITVSYSIIIGILNICSILLVIFFVFFYKYFYSDYYVNTKTIGIVMEILLNFCQSVYSCSTVIVNGNKKKEILFNSCIVIELVILLNYIFTYNKQFFWKNYFQFIGVLIKGFGFISGLVEISLKLIDDYFPSSIKWDVNNSYFKLFCELMLSLLLLLVIHCYKKSTYYHAIINNIFEDAKEKSNNYLLQMFQIIVKNDIPKINDFIIIHKKNAKKIIVDV